MLTADPGTMLAIAAADGAGSALEVPPIPPAATDSSPVPAIFRCQSRIASGRNPLITNGVSMACIVCWSGTCGN